MLELSAIVEHYAMALHAVDAMQVTNAPYRPGIGPFGERQALHLALQYLQAAFPQHYATAGPKAYPGALAQCDLVLPGAWAIEWKLLRPFGDNGKQAEHWSENVLHPYAGHTSAIGDCLKLLGSGFTERKAVLVYGFEHTPPQIPLDPAICAFEIVAAHVTAICLGPRHATDIAGLVHPVHQQLRVFGWEVVGGTGDMRT
jgi:hypothetical protein